MNSSLNSPGNEHIKVFIIKVFEDLINIKHELADLKRLLNERNSNCFPNSTNITSGQSSGVRSEEASTRHVYTSSLSDSLGSSLTNISAPLVPEYDVAICEMRANHHIPLLNQNEVTGSVKIWQRRYPVLNEQNPDRNSSSKIFLQIRLKGFRVFQRDDQSSTEKTVNGTALSDHSAQDTNSSLIIDESSFLPGNTYDPQHRNSSDKLTYYAISVHESADFSRDCQSTGSFFNWSPNTTSSPTSSSAVTQSSASSPTAATARPVGSLGNVVCNDRGESNMNVVIDGPSLFGSNGILNRSLVIRNQAQGRTAASAVRIGCCKIEPLTETSGGRFGKFLSSASQVLPP